MFCDEAYANSAEYLAHWQRLRRGEPVSGRFERRDGHLVRIVESGVDGLQGRFIEVDARQGHIDRLQLHDPASGALSGYACLMRDTTEVKRLVDLLQALNQALEARVAERFALSARGYHRVMRVARTIADLDGEDQVRRPHVAEAVSYRLMVGGQG